MSRKEPSESDRTKRNKDVDFLSSQMQSMSFEAPDKLVQREKWFCWDRAVVVAVFPYVNNTIYCLGKCLDTSQYCGRYVYYDDWADNVSSPDSEIFYLEGSACWNNKISRAQAVACDYDACAVGAAELDISSMSFHFNKENKTLLGIDTSGGFQVWDVLNRKGSQLVHGKFEIEFKATEYHDFSKRIEEDHYNMYGIFMNAICHTEEYIVGATHLDTGTNLFVYNYKINTFYDPIIVPVTGLVHMQLDESDPSIIWCSTDNGPFTLDTRFPVGLWTLVPSGRWLEIMMEKQKNTTVECKILDMVLLSGKYSTLVNKEKLTKKDLEVVEKLRTTEYPVFDKDVRPEYSLNSEDNLFFVSKDGVIWISLQQNALVPSNMAGILSATFVDGGAIVFLEDRSVAMIHDPWAKGAGMSTARQPVKRTFDPKATSVTRVNDSGCDTNFMVANINETMVAVHCFDEGIYFFNVEYANK